MFGVKFLQQIMSELQIACKVVGITFVNRLFKSLHCSAGISIVEGFSYLPATKTLYISIVGQISKQYH